MTPDVTRPVYWTMVLPTTLGISGLTSTNTIIQ